jgi:hypothetical protein
VEADCGHESSNRHAFRVLKKKKKIEKKGTIKKETDPFRKSESSSP